MIPFVGKYLEVVNGGPPWRNESSTRHLGSGSANLDDYTGALPAGRAQALPLAGL
jgi:hypothetical protein